MCVNIADSGKWVLVMYGLCECVWILQIVASEYLTGEQHGGVARVHVRVLSAASESVVPQFSESYYQAVIDENSPRGTSVAQLAVSITLVSFTN